MTEIMLGWRYEPYPSWDKTGTVGASWYAMHGKYTCRIDRFTEEEGGGWAYSVEYEGSPVKDGENEPAESFKDAEVKIIPLIK